MSEESAAPRGPSDSRPVVSVNEGPRRVSPWKLYLLLTVAFMLLALVTVGVLRKFSLRDALLPAQPPQRPVGTSIESTAGFTHKPVVAAPSTDSAHLADSPCLPSAVLDPQGNPILGAAGQPITVGCEPPMVARSTGAGTPTVSLPGAPGASTATVPAVARDRYGGGVMIEPAKPVVRAGELPPVPEEALETLRKVAAMGASPAGAGFSGLSPVSASIGPAAPPASGTLADVGPSRRHPDSPSTVDLRARERHVASRLTNRRFLALRGSQLECHLTLAYVSEIAGEAHCIIARDVMGQDGSTVLVDRGSIANGAFRAVTSLGERRANVIWDRVVTPGGVVVTLASKGTDALGGTGLPAAVDNRWLDRLGVAVAVSAVKDVSTALIARQAASAAGSQVVTSSQNFADQVLQQTIAVRPTLYVKQGDTAMILLQSDLDFSGVYAIRQ